MPEIILYRELPNCQPVSRNRVSVRHTSLDNHLYQSFVLLKIRPGHSNLQNFVVPFTMEVKSSTSKARHNGLGAPGDLDAIEA